MRGAEDDPKSICSACGAEMEADSLSCFTCGQPRASAVLRKGQVISGRYELTHILGQGGMGTVYAAHDRSLDERVALKVLSEAFRGSKEADRRFRDEIKLARRIRHPNVCGIHEYGEVEDIKYIVMEFIDGGDLKKYLHSRGALPTNEAVAMARQIAEGLQAIHDAGVIHRDLTLANVMRDGAGRLRLMDFGVAKFMGDITATATGHIIGTPEYMSPEQVLGLPLDPRTDLYSLGVITYELLTGRVPLRADTPLGTLMLQIHEAPRLDDPAVSGFLLTVLGKALAKNRDERFESARAFAAALAIAAGPPEPSQVPPPSDLAPGEAPTVEINTSEVLQLNRKGPLPGGVPATVRMPKGSRSPKRRFGPWMSASFAVFLALGTMVWLAVPEPGIEKAELERSQPVSEPPWTVTSPEPSPPPATTPSVAAAGVPTRPRQSNTEAPRPNPPPAPSPAEGALLVALPEPTPVPETAPPLTPPPASEATPATNMSPAPAFGYLQLGARPFARVIVDEKEVGILPMKPLELTEGRHVVRFLHPDFQPLQRIVTIHRGENAKLFVDFSLQGIAK